MPRKYLAFDLETSKDVPGEDFNWKPHRPLGISCAAAFPVDAKKPILWHGKNANGDPTERMSKAEARRLVQELLRYVANGYTVLTWNGLGFDFDILAEESATRDECKELALNHVDMMFHVFCDRGFPVALDKAAQALAIPGKPPGMSGLLAPQLWAQGRYRDVLDYVAQDVRIALQVALKCEERRRFEWITRKGTTSSINLARGWLIVREAFRLPEPDTSWMDSPIPRRDFTQWLDIE
ncbi:MAG: ribonuclease H-like domain-containing protein [Planctomycetes bacterium]|nr:ribonuclease H-like domain-containing protein [Planctomycetota bacterium]